MTRPQRDRYRAQHTPRGGRGAYTLAELLIVVTIMIILMAIALPVARKIMDDTQTREASRQFQAFLNMAQTRAAQTGRPAGLYLKCDPLLGDLSTDNVRQVTQLYLAEVPPPYIGSTLYARGEIYQRDPMTREFVPVTTMTQMDGTVISIRDDTELGYLRHLIGEGDLFQVRFDLKGPWYRCKRGINTDTTYPDPLRFYYMGFTQGGATNPVPPGFNDTAVSYNTARPFQIHLPPRRFGSPLELTGGTCIDMVYSGVGPRNNVFSTATTAVAVMFQPSGGIDSVWVDGQVDGTALLGSVHFLVGKVEKVNPIVGLSYTNPDQSNLADFNSLWVSIGRMGGAITTAENLFDPNAVPDTTLTPPETQFQAHIREARQVATSRDQMRGR
jgi:type II secretory pathway pseudopilin PulG